MARYCTHLDLCREFDGTELQTIKMALSPLGKTDNMVGIYNLGSQSSIEALGREDISGQIIIRAIEEKTKSYYKELHFFKNLSDWSAEW